MVGKGKLICKVGDVAVLMEDHGSGEKFRLCLLKPNSDDIQASTWLEVFDVVWLIKNLDTCINTLIAHNVQENWYGN